MAITTSIATLGEDGNPVAVSLSRLASKIGYDMPESDADVWELYGAACECYSRQDWFVLDDAGSSLSEYYA